jgi:hypothetical protein
VPQALLERPTTAATSGPGDTFEPVRPSGRGRRRALALGAAVLGLALLAPVADRGLDLLPGSGLDPLAPEVVDHSGPALMVALADMGEYHAAKATFQSVVDLERDTPWVPSVISGERTTYLATGSVDGIVDLPGLETGGVTVSPDGKAVTISLPPARLGEVAIDVEGSRVLTRDRGMVDRVGSVFADSPTTERDVMLAAEDKLEAAAAESDLLRRAEENTRQMLTGLARSMGFDQVTVTFDAADRT